MNLYSRDKYQPLVSVSKDSSLASIEIKQKAKQLNVDKNRRVNFFFKKRDRLNSKCPFIKNN